MKLVNRTLYAVSIMMLLCSSIVFSGGTTITLLHVNDTHSHLDAVGPKDQDLSGTLGGIAKAATVIGTVRATEQNVLLLHAGDAFQGDPFFNTYFGVPELQLMAQMGFDAMAVGNHEFDFGPGVLNDVLSTAFADGSFPLVSANLDMTAFSQLTSWIQPSVIKTVGGVKIGIFGMTVPNNATNMPAPVIVQDNVVDIAQQSVTNLKAAGVDVVVFLSHLGIYYDKIIAANVNGIDFIIGGHDHLLLSEPLLVSNPSGKSVPIVQAGEYYQYVGELKFTIENGSISIDAYSILPVDASVPPEPNIQALIASLKAGINAQFGDLYGTVIGTAALDLSKRSDPSSPWRDTPLGNLVTDAFRAKTKTEIAITANGLISEKIFKGPIVGADIFRSLSYGFDESTGFGLSIATFTIRGSDLLKGLEIGLSRLEVDDDFFLQVSGMTFKYDQKRPVGHRVVMGSIRINDKPFQLQKSYTVTVNTGILMLLTALGINAENIQMMPDFEYSVVKDYIEDLGTVHYGVEGRIRDMSVHTSSNGLHKETSTGSVNRFQLNQNFPNPFNPSTSISYSLPHDSYVTLKIYNSIGQVIATLVNGVRTAGAHEEIWVADGMPSGMYFYRLQMDQSTETKKMLFMK